MAKRKQKRAINTTEQRQDNIRGTTGVSLSAGSAKSKIRTHFREDVENIAEKDSLSPLHAAIASTFIPP